MPRKPDFRQRMKHKMASCPGPGYHSPPTIGRTVDRIFEDAQFTGEIYLNGRKLRDYPKICSKYDLSDTILVDISRNRLTEVPHEVCEYLYVERINCYNNVIRSISDAIQQLQVLTHLSLSRNQLSVLPPALCQLSCLEVLHVSNNKLVSLPEEIKHLTSLMDLDVSCNELSHLPVQIGELSSLRCLNLRRNFLVELPIEISRLQLYKLDFSSNRIEKIPTVFRKMQTLEQLILDHNPLSSPPAYVCIKGRQHIMKYLHMEAVKEDRKRGILMGSDTDIKKFIRKSLPPQQPSDEFKNMLGTPESKWKRHTVLSNDSGYSTADGLERNGWQSGEIFPLSEVNNNNHQLDILKKYRDQHHHHQQICYQANFQHLQQTDRLQYQQDMATPNSVASHNHMLPPGIGRGLQQHSVPSAYRGDICPESTMTGRTSPARVSTSNQQQYHQYHQDQGSSHLHRSHVSSTSTYHQHSPAVFSSSASSSTFVRQSTPPVQAFCHSSDRQTTALHPAFRHSSDGQTTTPHPSSDRQTTTPHPAFSYGSDRQTTSPYPSSDSQTTTPHPAFRHSSDRQATSLGGLASGMPISRQRSNTSLSDYQSREYMGTLPPHTTERAYSPARFTSSFRYGTNRHPPTTADSSINDSQLPQSSSSSTDSSQRNCLPSGRNIYQLPGRSSTQQVRGESPPATPPTPPLVMSAQMEDEFTRELKRQKAEYERKKKQAELIRVQQEEEDEEREKEERRRAALKLQEEQKVVMQKQEEQRRQEELHRQEEFKRQEELRLAEVKRRKEEEESRRREEEVQKLQDTARIQEGERIIIKAETDTRAESKLLDKNNLINKNSLSSQSFKEQRKLANSIQYRRAASDTVRKPQTQPTMAQMESLSCINRNGMAENSHQSSTSTTPSVSPSPSPRNSVSHLAKPHSPSGSTSHLAKSISPSGSTSHLVKPTGTKSAVPRAANGPATPVQNQAVRKAKLVGDRSNTASPVTARSTRTVPPGGLRAMGSALTSAPPAASNLRRSSNSSTATMDDESKLRKGPSVAPSETSRLKAHLDEHNKKGLLTHGSTGGKMHKSSDHPADNVDTNKRISNRPPTSTNIYGLGRGRPGGPKTLEDSSSNLSIHKKEEKEEAEQMDRLRQMVESRLRVTLPDNLAEALRDGVVLCHLANHVRPRSVGSIHVPSPAVPKLTLAKCRRNVDNFLDACRKIGVDQEQLCGPQDIFDEKGISRVAITVAALVAVGSNPRQSAV